LCRGAAAEVAVAATRVYRLIKIIPIYISVISVIGVFVWAKITIKLSGILNYQDYYSSKCMHT
jgi:hypothetical protein